MTGTAKTAARQRAFCDSGGEIRIKPLGDDVLEIFVSNLLQLPGRSRVRQLDLFQLLLQGFGIHALEGLSYLQEEAGRSPKGLVQLRQERERKSAGADAPLDLRVPLQDLEEGRLGEVAEVLTAGFGRKSRHIRWWISGGDDGTGASREIFQEVSVK